MVDFVNSGYGMCVFPHVTRRHIWCTGHWHDLTHICTVDESYEFVTVNCRIILVVTATMRDLCCFRMDVNAMNETLLEYEKKLPDPHYCLMAVSVRRHLTLPPKCLSKMADGIREQLDSKLKLYSDEYVVLFYSVCELTVLYN